ncbi:crotonyl-CoA carboxylase/reductase [Actinomadura litoris]|uniref:crotonyl-CoA carboxylase/reductase n=1 Tax=Actinomadura litoris TaxID=2678616 RepID=UPI001FA71F54|nr:crotonyl-CoA carboxylase/reductase [Actinomadura litoris]
MSIEARIPIGEVPPPGTRPGRMFAQVVRQGRFGDPLTAFEIEEVPVPEPGPGEVLVAVMAAGINFNNVWAARGTPIDVIADRRRKGEPWDFHIGGSDASGIVHAVGEGVESVSPGDRIVVHPGHWDPDDPWVKDGGDPMLAPSAKIWGYNTNFGSFAQFCLAQEHQILPKAPHLTWAEAAAPTLVGTTAYRMLFGWDGHRLRPGDLVLVWGGSGGLGTQAIQLAVAHGADAVAVVSDDRRGEYATRLGAIGYLNRGGFAHWGVPPHWDDAPGYGAWMKEARRFRQALSEIAGRRSPRIVFEHPGEATIPTSVFLCAPGGMVVICAGTSGYSATVDLRYQWVMQKRLQGSHGTNDEQARAYNDLVREGRIDPSLGEVVPFHEIGRAHHDMASGVEVFGNRVALVGAPDEHAGVTAE